MELIIDNFAGGGGASTGIEIALGLSPDVSINHDRHALAMHRMNHPDTEHYCEDVFEIDPRVVTKGKPVGLGWFSPDCTHFSKAKGGKPKSKRIRGLAWVVINWVNKVKPRVIILENVEEFQKWTPLKKDGHPNNSWRKSWYFQCFIGALRRRGYSVDFRELRACDYGSPTIRKRFFLIARCDGKKIVWPDETHGRPEESLLGLNPYRTAAECIDWSFPVPSIFGRKRPLADATCKRIAAGVVKYVLTNPRPFIIEFANRSQDRNWTVDEPLRTQCAQVKGGHFALVAPTLIHAGHGEGKCGTKRWSDGTRDIQVGLNTITASGSPAYLVAAFLNKHYTGVIGSNLQKPIGTVTSVDHHSLTCVHLIRHFGESIGSGIDQPVGTITGGGMGKAGLVYSFLIKYYGNDKGGIPLSDPMHTVVSKDRFGLVTVNVDGETYALTDIGMRMLQPHELYRAQGFPEEYIIDRGLYEDGEESPFTKTNQVKMCGNSVCPDLASALVSANVPDLIAGQSKYRSMIA